MSVPTYVKSDIPSLYPKSKYDILFSLFISHCDETELIDIMKEFDNNKASDININVLKSISKLIVGHLVKNFNKFLDIGIFPTILKSGMITPIFKKGGLTIL